MARLAFNLNNGNEFVFDLDLDHMSLGRTSENDIVISNSFISGRHCVFRRDPLTGEWEVLDLNSQNGVTVNGARIDRSPLQHGDKIGLGQVEARFHLPNPSPLRPPRGGATSRIPKTSPDATPAPAVAPAPGQAAGDVGAIPRAPSPTEHARPAAPAVPPRPLVRAAPPGPPAGSTPSSPKSEPDGGGPEAELAQVRKDLTATRQILARRTASLEQLRQSLEAATEERSQLKEQIAQLAGASEELQLQIKELSDRNTELTTDLARAAEERARNADSAVTQAAPGGDDATVHPDVMARLSSLEEENARASATIAELNSQLSAARSNPHPPTQLATPPPDLEGVTNRLAIASAEHAALLRENSQIQLETATLERRRAFLAEELERLAESHSQASGQLSALAGEIERAKGERAELEQALAPTRSAHLAATAELEALRQAALQEITNRNEAAQALSRLQQEAGAVRTEVAALEQRRSQEQAALGELRSSLEMARHEATRRAEITSEVEAKRTELSELQRRVSQAEEERQQAESRVALAEAALREIQAEALKAGELRSQIADLEGRRAALEEEISQRRIARELVGQTAIDPGELTAGLIERIDLLDNLIRHVSRRDDTPPELIGQFTALRSSLIDLLREAGVDEVSIPAGTPIDLDLRRRIKIVERAESGGDQMPKVLETLRPGFISAQALGRDLVLRKVEVKTS